MVRGSLYCIKGEKVTLYNVEDQLCKKYCENTEIM